MLIYVSKMDVYGLCKNWRVLKQVLRLLICYLVGLGLGPVLADMLPGRSWAKFSVCWSVSSGTSIESPNHYINKDQSIVICYCNFRIFTEKCRNTFVKITEHCQREHNIIIIIATLLSYHINISSLMNDRTKRIRKVA